MWAQATRRFTTTSRSMLASSHTAVNRSLMSQSNTISSSKTTVINASALTSQISSRATNMTSLQSSSPAIMKSQGMITAIQNHQQSMSSQNQDHQLSMSMTVNPQSRTLFDWALRPYAFSKAASAATGLTTLNAGFSNVGLSLLVCPWKALPTALIIAPMMYMVPAAYKMLFHNCSRGSVNSVFQGFCTFTLVFLPVPAFENLFAELTFYITALCLTFFIYNLLPELMLEDGIWIFYSALFVMPFLPLAFAYMPTFVPRSYLIL